MDFTLLIHQLLQFLGHPDKAWSICTIPFLVTFVLFYALYLVLQRSRRTVIASYVIAFSLFFAWKANGLLMLLLPLMVVSSWYLTRLMISRYNKTWRKAWTTLIILLNLTPLIYYKYTNFVLSSLNDILHSNFALADLVLPVGISFYTFQAISYTIDVYRGRCSRSTDLLSYAFYLTFFPLLMAGPITRAEVLIPQIEERKECTRELAYGGFFLILTGMLKKLLIADYIAQYNNWIFEDPLGYSGFENLMGVLGYTLQIYCDFSGYSDMSIGLAAILGFELRENFNFPYQANNLQDFWRRWHIALSTWFRDYLYIPMGGNRKGEWRTYLNNFITMLVAGLWHGSTWMFVIWGALHGGGLVVHKACRRLFLDRIPDTWPVRCLCWTVTFIYVMIAWVFFRATSVDNALTILHQIATNCTFDYFVPFIQARPTWSIFLAIGFLLQLMRRRHYDLLQQEFIRVNWVIKTILLIITIQLIINYQQGNVQPFIYANF